MDRFGRCLPVLRRSNNPCLRLDRAGATILPTPRRAARQSTTTNGRDSQAPLVLR